MIDFAARLADAGIALAASIDAPVGCTTVLLEPSEVPQFLSDKERWTARYWGVSIDVFRAWKRDEAMARCGGKTAKGQRCKNIVGSELTPAEFEALDGSLCRLHSGQSH